MERKKQVAGMGMLAVLGCLWGLTGCGHTTGTPAAGANESGQNGVAASSPSNGQAIGNGASSVTGTGQGASSNASAATNSANTQSADTNQASGSGQPPANGTASAPPQLPTPPPVSAADVPFSPLSQSTLDSDTKTLQQAFASHPGDSITRGPTNLVYNIGMHIYPSHHRFEATESLHLTNNLGKALPTLYFNVWPDSAHYQQQGSNEVVSHVEVNGSAAEFTLQGTVLTITPSQPIEAGASASVQMDVSAILPHNTDRYGFESTGLNLGNWYPILAVNDQNGWVTPPYYSQGESFYSLTGSYHLAVTAPKDLVMAVTGEQTATQSNPDGTVTTTYEASKVRDVAMVANTAYKVIQDKVGPVTVYTYYTPTQANDAQWMEQSAVRAVKNYNQWYGSYPYATLRICAMQGWFGGMEYPQLDMISFQPNGNAKAETQLIVDHEVAHQWFFGLVGDDEYLTPMLDESFAEFTQSILDNAIQTLTNVPPISKNAEPSDPVSAFSDSAARPYFYAVYLDGANMLYDLYTKLGANDFHTMMQAYVKQYEYRVATISDFVNFVSQYTGTDMTSWFAQHGVNVSDGQSAPVQSWATAGMQRNGFSWHHSN